VCYFFSYYSTHSGKTQPIDIYQYVLANRYDDLHNISITTYLNITTKEREREREGEREGERESWLWPSAEENPNYS